MKQSRTCPKCGSKEVIQFMEATQNGKDNGNHIYCGFYNHARIWRYVCCDCGYSEQYVDIPEIKKIRPNRKRSVF